MIDKEEYQLIVDAAVLYYLEGKIQSEIAKELYLSRPKVSRLLKKARELKIVDITINYQSDEMERLQGEVRRLFGIPNVIVVKSLTDKNETLRQVGKAAAKELGMVLHDNMVLGISWGKHVRITAEYMKKHNYINMDIVELFGAISYDVEQKDMLSIGKDVAGKLNGSLYPLSAPIYIKDPLARDAIVETPLIKRTLEEIENCDLILTGIGVVEGDSLQTLWNSYVDLDMKRQVIVNGGVGFILAHFFNEKGEFLDIEANKTIVGIKTEDIRTKPIMAMASGVSKAKAIHAALKGGLLDTLVVDEETLRIVVEIEKKNNERKAV